MTTTQTQYLCVATRLHLKRWRDLPAFLRMTWAVRRQARSSPGLAASGVKARFLRREFWTFSIWKDRGSMQAFVKAEPHATAVRRFERWAGEGTAFVEWASGSPRVDWREAQERMRNPTFRYGQERR